MLKLYIGNKNYSSWSMRPWVLLTQAGIPFEEVMLPFDSFAADSQFKRSITTVNPLGKVPVLVDGDLTVYDSLSIAEYLAERFPEKQLWPRAPKQRAHARSICAEMHCGFSALRQALQMNIEAHLPDIGALAWRDQPQVRKDIERIFSIWGDLLQRHGGPLLFADFSIADAYFAPVVMRLNSYQPCPLPAAIATYTQAVTQLPGVAAWIKGALAEKTFVPFEEPYRLHASHSLR